MSFIKIFLIIVLTIPFLTSCINGALQREIKAQDTERTVYEKYYENFTNFTINKNKSGLVFLGKNYNYVFKDQKEIIKKLFSWENILNLDVTVDFDKDIVISTNDYNRCIKNNLILKVNGKNKDKAYSGLSPLEINFLKELGFESKNNIFTQTITISAIRYSSKPKISYDNLFFLNKEHEIGITVSYKTKDRSIKNKIKLATLTPFALIGDAITLITIIPFMISIKTRDMLEKYAQVKCNDRP